MQLSISQDLTIGSDKPHLETGPFNQNYLSFFNSVFMDWELITPKHPPNNTSVY